MKHVNSIELSDSDIESVKKIALDILTEIDKICRENNLKYSLASGTLLGAVRHKGFIPWDDDVDIVMLYEDYQKFLEIANSKLDKKFYIATPEKETALKLWQNQLFSENHISLIQKVIPTEFLSIYFRFIQQIIFISIKKDKTLLRKFAKACSI